MKYIIKQHAPAKFIQWKALENQNWQPTYDNLDKDVKDAIKNSLMTEQGGICCYCESRLSFKDSHIEHFNPQSNKEIDPLDYDNMLCSCQRDIPKGAPRHCGNLKDNWFDDNLLVSPLDPDCETRFSFTGNGEIRPTDKNDTAAKETINRLGLDLPKLNNMRKSAIAGFADDTLTESEFKKFVTGYLQKDIGGNFNAYWTTIRHLFSP